jgi:CRP-like cAMP-binding protein
MQATSWGESEALGQRIQLDGPHWTHDHQPPASGERIDLQPSARLNPADVYFPLESVLALSLVRDGARFQVGFARRGDVVGIHTLLLPAFPQLSAQVLRPGSAIRVPRDQLARALEEDRGFHERLLRYAFRSTSEFLGEAAAVIALSLEQRVARWIASYRSVIGRDELTVTHQEMATALGVRRSGVTVALHILEGERLIRSRRGRLQILNAEALLDYAAVGRGSSLRAA